VSIFLYTPGAGVQALKPLGSNPAATIGNGLNNFGQITGFFYPEIYVQHAFVYTPGKRIVDISTPFDHSVGNVINNAGQVTGWCWSAAFAENSMYAFLYTPGEGMKSLGALGTNINGISVSEGYGINNIGQVVGGSSISGCSYCWAAFLYSDGKMIDLNTLLPPSSGWTLTNAQKINDSGQIIGQGTINGQRHSFLMTLVR
jgi:probable HAF family extracellular repeat protein